MDAADIKRLKEAAEAGRDGEIKNILSQPGAEVDTRAYQGTTALMCAAEAGHQSTVKLLISFKANVNARNENGKTHAA